MIAEYGHFALTLAFAVAVVQSAVPLYAASRGDRRLMAVASGAALALAALVAVAFLALMWAYVTSDFSVATSLSTPTRSSRCSTR